MPGQVTHFYLASRLALQFKPFKDKDIRGEIYKGFDRWLSLNKKFKEDVEAIIAAEKKSSTTSENADKMQATLNTYRKNLLQSDEIAMFSAFAAGAVGPDLWTIPHSATLDLLIQQSIQGGWFFDLGHYNLSHIFPKYTLKQIRKVTDPLQKRYQTAYILGYISHISLDIVAHLNVNVFAGAYHKQQEKQWEPEQGNIKEKKNMFNNHNKVEHYLDAYIKFFCFEGCHDDSKYDYKKTVKEHFGQKEDWNFPNYADYYSKKLQFGRIIKTDGIYNEDCHFLDLSTSLPGVFVHRYHLKPGKTCDYGVDGSKKVESFIWQYYWDAYNNKDDWMGRNQTGLVDDWLKTGRQSLSSIKKEHEQELVKLEFFNFIDDADLVEVQDQDGRVRIVESDWRDINDEITTQYYYIHTLIPDLAKVHKYSKKFFSPADFGHFIQAARNIAESFIDNAMKYLDDGDPGHLDCLDHWNLDTGLAWRINAGKDRASYSVPVSIDIISVLDLPELGWQISSIKDIPVKATDEWSPVPFENKTEEEIELEAKKTLFSIPLKTHLKHKLIKPEAIGIEIQVTQTCFYGHDYSEIDAFIFGDSEKKEKPWVKGEDADPEDKTKKAFKIGTLIEDFKSDYAQVEDKTSAGRKSRLYKTVFIGHTRRKPVKKDTVKKDNGTKEETMESPLDRTLARHVKISTCRKGINYVAETGNFHPDKLIKYKTVFPSEDMVFSLFALFKRTGEDGKAVYEDIYHDIPPFKEGYLKELKKIKIVGLNIILLILGKDENKNVVLEEAWIDGERQT